MQHPKKDDMFKEQRGGGQDQKDERTGKQHQAITLHFTTLYAPIYMERRRILAGNAYAGGNVLKNLNF